MRTTTCLLPCLVALVLVAPSAQAAQDAPFQLRIGGRLQADLNHVFQKEPFGGLLGKFESGTEVRRARLYAQGRAYERVEYKFEVDFAGGSVEARDMYVGIRGWPVAARFGHLKEPFSIEELTSGRFITFMERSLVNMFSPSRNMGLIVGRAFNDGRSTWAAGVFRDSDGFAASPGDNYNFTGRFTHALVYSGDSRKVLHLGLGLQHKEVDGFLRLRSRPGDHNAPGVIDVRIPATSADYASFELSANIGSLGLQAEYLSAWTRSADLGDPRLWGAYAQGSYLLTGETRPYSDGRFVRLKPRHNFPDGPGAWEVGLRYARVDLSEASPTSPNTLWNLTVGLNWYWTPNVRFTANYELAEIPQIAGEKFSAMHVRFWFDF